MRVSRQRTLTPMQHGEAQQSRCDSFRHAQQRRVLHQLCGPANTLAQELYQVCRQLGLGAQQAEELVAPDNRQLGAHHRRCRCRPCHPVEQSYLAKRVARPDDVEKNLLAAGPAGADAHPPAHNSAQRVTRIAAQEDDSPFRVDPPTPECRNPLQCHLRQPTEQTVPLEHGFCSDGQN